MSATYPMDMVRGRITVQVHFLVFTSSCDMVDPLDLVHTRCLFFSLAMQTEKSPYQYRGMFHALGTVYREEGFRALYKGWLPSVIGVVSILQLLEALFIIYVRRWVV